MTNLAINANATVKTAMTKLNAAGADKAMSAGGARHAQLEEKAQQFVATAFFGEMFRQMRESPFKSEVMSGGRAGDAYSGMLHQTLAERMGRGAGRSLVESIVKSLQKQTENQARRSFSDQSKLNVAPVGGVFNKAA
jgi:Rod binding domain-containing protein